MRREPKLNERQRAVLSRLRRWQDEGFIPSSSLRCSLTHNPGPLLKRLEARGLVESNGVVMPDGRVYRITDAGIKALSGESSDGR